MIQEVAPHAYFVRYAAQNENLVIKEGAEANRKITKYRNMFAYFLSYHIDKHCNI